MAIRKTRICVICVELKYNKISMPKVYTDKKRHIVSLHEQKQEIRDAIAAKRQQVAVTEDPEKKGLLLTEIESNKRNARACIPKYSISSLVTPHPKT